MRMTKNPIITALVVILSLPILLHILNPSLHLGGVGLLLGFWGLFVSPIIILGYVVYRYKQRKAVKTPYF